MDYRDDDRWLFGDNRRFFLLSRRTKRALIGFGKGFAAAFMAIVFFSVVSSILGCDLQAAQATHESVMDMQKKKEQLPPEARINSRLLSIPVGTTWVEQSGN